mgnify:CR=1 FL=1
MKHQIWCGAWGENARNAASVLKFCMEGGANFVPEDLRDVHTIHPPPIS